MSMRARMALFLLSAATLIFEINLTRLFSVAQFYHFAFMIVSMALLGFGASGTFLALFPGFGRRDPRQSLGWLALASGTSSLGAYLLMNWLPFDSFSIAWDRRQVGILLLNYLALTAPFFFSGLGTGLLLAAQPQSAGKLYAANLTGSALGSAAALVAAPFLGGAGNVVFSSGLAALAAVLCLSPAEGRSKRAVHGGQWAALALLLSAALDCGLRAGDRASFAHEWLDMRLSPYKGLSYILQYPGSQVISQRWNAFSRLDVVRSPSIRSVPGLSYRYLQPIPVQNGLLVDGDELSPILLPGSDLTFCQYLPSAVAFQLRPHARVLALEPRGGMEVVCALAARSARVTAVETNPLIVAAAPQVYQHPDVHLALEFSRSFTRRSSDSFDIILLALAAGYHPVRSGAYSLAEDYRYTVEAFQDALARLDSQGVLVAMRWLQTPPSESLRAFALAVTALEKRGVDPAACIVALRGYNTATLLVKNEPFSPEELAAVRAFAASRAFDLVYAPGLRPEETNQYNVLPEPVYTQAFLELLRTQPRQAFYDRYPFDVSPPSDDRPFFGHFFKWSQAGQVMAELGKTWQPFGGAGYFVILAVLALAALLAGALILLPAGLAPRGGQPARSPLQAACLAYFGCIGLAYLLVEIPLVQRFILFLGNPAYALTAVLASLLFFSGLGSLASARLSPRLALGGLVALLLAAPSALTWLFAHSLGFSLPARLALTALYLAPLGLLMGVPFPAGVRWLARSRAAGFLIPWSWAVNGAASVIASILAALLALSFGFRWVFWLGALCYLAAWLAFMALARRSPAQLPGP